MNYNKQPNNPPASKRRKSNDTIHTSNHIGESTRTKPAPGSTETPTAAIDLDQPKKQTVAQLTTLPLELVAQIMSWIRPTKVWPLRGLSKAFNNLISSTSFASLNLDRILPYDAGSSVYYKLGKFFDGPESYQSEYVRKYLIDCCTIRIYQEFPHPIPKIWLRELKNLVHWKMSQCGLVGTIPHEIGNLNNLETLEFFDNKLVGEIPSTIGNLVRLTSLVLSEERLEGYLPSELGNLALLTNLEVTCKNVMGPIPVEIGNLTKLEVLKLSFKKNRLVPNHLPRELGKLTSLVLLDLNCCRLDGTIPLEFGELVHLRYIDLSRNNLNGTVPAEFTQLAFDYCGFHGNPKLSFPFPVPANWSVNQA